MTININWAKLFDITYWLEGIAGGSNSLSITPPNNKVEFFFWFWLSLFAAFWFVGIGIKIWRAWIPEKHPLKNDWKISFWSNNFLWIAVLGDFWFLFRQINVPFLGSRLWIIIGFIWLIVVLYFIIRYFTFNWPMERMYYKRQKAMDKLQKN